MGNETILEGQDDKSRVMEICSRCGNQLKDGFCLRFLPSARCHIFSTMKMTFAFATYRTTSQDTRKLIQSYFKSVRCTSENRE